LDADAGRRYRRGNMVTLAAYDELMDAVERAVDHELELARLDRQVAGDEASTTSSAIACTAGSGAT
jgi:hypothetical protein